MASPTLKHRFPSKTSKPHLKHVSPRSRTKPANLIQVVDSLANHSEKASNWQEYPFFWMLRHPRLQPSRPKIDGASIIAFQTDRKTFENLVHESFCRLRSKLPEVLKQLSDDLQQQLAAILCDCQEDFELYATYSNSSKRTKQLVVTGEAKQRKYDRSLRELKKALERNATDAQSLHSLSQDYGAQVTFAKETLKKMEGLDCTKRSKQDWLQMQQTFPRIYPVRDNPTDRLMVFLFSFFHHGSGLSKNEAELRVGLIRNTFWHDWVAPVRVRHRSTVDESRGCSAVHAAVRRFNLQPST
jgi:hypothetical protein